MSSINAHLYVPYDLRGRLLPEGQISNGLSGNFIVGDYDSDALTGGDSDDELVGVEGNDTLDGGDGLDAARYDLAFTGVSVDLAAGTARDGYGDNDIGGRNDEGTDTLISIEIVVGSAFGDTLVGDSNDNFLDGHAGNDILRGGNGSDAAVYLDAGSGVFANLSTGSASDGDGGTDTLSEIENLFGSEHNDTLTGDVNDNVLLGLRGDDRLEGRAGNDYINGGAGTDSARYDNASAAVNVDLAEQTASDGEGGTDTLINIENVFGGAHDDTINGDGNGNQLFGNGGSDLITGGAGFDILHGNGGNDTLDGGADTDTASYEFARAGVFANLNTGTASDGEGGTDLLVDIEILIGSDFNDTLIGDENDNVLIGHEGNDSLDGGAGNDLLVVSAGDNLLNGGAGNDVLSGGSGNDTVDGGAGNDVVSGGVSGNNLVMGGAGDDSVAGSTGNDTLVGGEGSDYFEIKNQDTYLEIADFELGVDKLDLQGIDRAEALAALANAEAGSAILTFGSGLVVRVAGENVTPETLTIDNFVFSGDGTTVDGTSASEALSGDNDVNTINGFEGDDTLTGFAGDDELNGGAGTDTALYSGSQSSYTLTLSPTQTILEDRRSDGNGTDRLIDLELLDFDTGLLGGPFDLRIFAGPAGLDAPELESFIELYIAYFNRAPDAVGLNFWGTAFANGTSLNETASLFIDQDETRATYPETLTNSDFATAVYNNVLGRIPDVDGFNFWVGVLDNGSVTRDTFILDVLRGAKAEPAEGATQAFIDQQAVDQKYLSDKTDLGAYFSVHKGLSDVTDATNAMAIFDGTAGSITNAVTAIDGFYADALDADTGAFLMPLIGVIDDPFA